MGNRSILIAVCCLVVVGLFAGAGFTQDVLPSTTGVMPKDITPKQTVPAPSTSAAAEAKTEGKIKVVFDENTPGVVYVESNGERIRVDTGKKSVENVAMLSGDEVEKPKAPVDTTLAAKPVAKPADKDSDYDFDKGEEPYDYRIVNVPTAKNVPKGTWNLLFTIDFRNRSSRSALARGPCWDWIALLLPRSA